MAIFFLSSFAAQTNRNLRNNRKSNTTTAMAKTPRLRNDKLRIFHTFSPVFGRLGFCYDSTRTETFYIYRYDSKQMAAIDCAKQIREAQIFRAQKSATKLLVLQFVRGRLPESMISLIADRDSDHRLEMYLSDRFDGDDGDDDEIYQFLAHFFTRARSIERSAWSVLVRRIVFATIKRRNRKIQFEKYFPKRNAITTAAAATIRRRSRVWRDMNNNNYINHNNIHNNNNRTIVTETIFEAYRNNEV